MRKFLESSTAGFLDALMCIAMNAVQWRHRLDRDRLAALEQYIVDCAPLTREQFYAASVPPLLPGSGENRLQWASPIASGFAGNDRVQVDLFPCARGWSAPTVFMLHALLSAGDRGYRAWAQRFNDLGWNAAFIHLPYHYSRTPPGTRNGELAITCDLVRTGEGLRQGVIELRQLMALLRQRGCREFGLWATSYGAWIGALLCSVERDLRFAALMSPIVNVEHTIWQSGAAWKLRRELQKAGITQSLIERHFHLSSPLHGPPAFPAERVLIGAGEYDRLVPAREARALAVAWPGSELLMVRQGHFGYRMMREVFARVQERGDLKT